MKPSLNKVWTCRNAIYDTQSHNWTCALKLFDSNLFGQRVAIVPVRGCYPWECCNNPNSDRYEPYGTCGGKCALSAFEKSGKCPHEESNGTGSFCKVGIMMVRARIESDTLCRAAYTFDQIGGCPHYAEATKNEIKTKLIEIANEMMPSSAPRHTYRGKPLRWIIEAEKFAGTHVLSDRINKLVEISKKQKEQNENKIQ